MIVKFRITWLATGAPIKHYFWECLWGCFWEVSVLIAGLSKVDCSPQSRWASSNPLRTWVEQSILFFYLSAWAETSHLSFSGPFTGMTLLAPLVLSPTHSDCITPQAFLSLQLKDSRWWHFSASLMTWTNSSISLHWFCFFGESSLIHGFAIVT